MLGRNRACVFAFHINQSARLRLELYSLVFRVVLQGGAGLRDYEPGRFFFFLRTRLGSNKVSRVIFQLMDNSIALHLNLCMCSSQGVHMHTDVGVSTYIEGQQGI